MQLEFQLDWIKIVDFLLVAKFKACLLFFYPYFKSMAPCLFQLLQAFFRSFSKTCKSPFRNKVHFATFVGSQTSVSVVCTVLAILFSQIPLLCRSLLS